LKSTIDDQPVKVLILAGLLVARSHAEDCPEGWLAAAERHRDELEARALHCHRSGRRTMVVSAACA
jgi:hypothetical protein